MSPVRGTGSGMTDPRGMNVRFVGAFGYEDRVADDIEELLTRDDGFVWLDLGTRRPDPSSRTSSTCTHWRSRTWLNATG